MEHLKEVALEVDKEIDISVGAYITLFAKYLKVNIYKEKVEGNPNIGLTYLIEQWQILTAWYEKKTRVHIYVRMEDSLLGFVCSKTIKPTPSSDANTSERTPTKELEVAHPLIVEDEPSNEPERESQAD